MDWLQFLALTAIILVWEVVKAFFLTFLFAVCWALKKKLTKLPVRLDVMIYNIESTVDEIYALLQHFRGFRLRIQESGPWEFVTVLRSSNNGYLSRQFYSVAMRDFGYADDPFWPAQVSIIHVLEIRRCSAAKRSLIIWQVSMLNGGQRKLHEFKQWSRRNADGRLFARRYQESDTKCYQSDGVIFVTFRDFGKWLYVYDTRYNKWAAYKRIPAEYTAAEEWTTCSVSISCLGRLRNGDGKVEGWRIRMIDAYLTRTVTQEEMDDFRRRPCLIKTIFDLRIRCKCCGREDANLIEQEEIMWNSFAVSPNMHVLRTSGALVGVFAQSPNSREGPIMFFDELADGYVFCGSFREFRRRDHQFTSYFKRAAGDFLIDALYPMVLTGRECIKCFDNGTVFRLPLAPDKFEYSALKAVFRSNPGLRYRMSADQFQRESGIPRMELHFG